MMVPAWLDTMVKEFGRSAGVQNFALGERGAAALSFETGAELRLEYAGEELVMAVTVPAYFDAGRTKLYPASEIAARQEKSCRGAAGIRALPRKGESPRRGQSPLGAARAGAGAPAGTVPLGVGGLSPRELRTIFSPRFAKSA